MSKPGITYCDGLLDISYFNGMVHFSVGHVQPDRSGEGNPQGVVVERFAMQPAALLRSMRQMEQMAERLVEREVFVRKDGETAAAVETDETPEPVQVAADD